jgi:hypothetical protein
MMNNVLCVDCYCMNKQHKGCNFHEQDSAVLFFLEVLFNIYGYKGRDGTVAKPFDAITRQYGTRPALFQKICVVLCIVFVSFCVLFVCKCVLYCCGTVCV